MKPFPALVLALTLITPAAHAQPKQTAEQILDGWVKAMGGAAAFAKVRSSRAVGTVSLPAQGVKGELEVLTKAPNKFLMRLNLTGFGEIITGFDGTTGWAKDPVHGVRQLTGSELSQLKGQALQANAPQNWRGFYKKVELLGTRKAAGTTCYALRLTPRDGTYPLTQYHDTKTFYLLRADSEADTPDGKVAGEAYTSDYRTVDGIKTAFKLRQVVPGVQEMVMQLSQVKNNVPLADTLFAKPAAEPKKKM